MSHTVGQTTTNYLRANARVPLGRQALRFTPTAKEADLNMQDPTCRGESQHWSTALIALLVGIAVFFAACDICVFCEENIEGTIENRTDSVLCFHYDYARIASTGRCSFKLKPHTSADWFFECGDGPGTEKALVAVLITVKEGGRLIYQRTEECRVWQASEGKFVIEQRGDDFIVTDYLADTTPSP